MALYCLLLILDGNPNDYVKTLIEDTQHVCATAHMQPKHGNISHLTNFNLICQTLKVT